MKHFVKFFAVTIASLTIPAFAEIVSLEDAAETAQGYVAYANGDLLGGDVGITIADSFAVEADYEGGKLTLAYGFNFAGGGWVLVAADDRMVPVVGFGHEGAIEKAAYEDEASPIHSMVTLSLLEAYKAFEEPREAVASATDGEEAVAAADVFAARAAAARSRRDKYRSALPKPGPDGVVEPSAKINTVSDIRVDTLMVTRWNQSGHGENYYSYQQFHSALGSVVSGCTQTALGQIFYHLRWPTAARGVYKVDKITTGGGKNQTTSQRLIHNDTATSLSGKVIKVNDEQKLGLETQGLAAGYQWDKMFVANGVPYPDNTGTADDHQKALGALLWDIAIANGATFNSGSTSASVNPPELREIFGYANMKTTSISDYNNRGTRTQAQTTALVNAAHCNLDAGLPVELTGYTYSGGGHAVVIDGYGFQDGDACYHINFGWGGSSDGYYTWENWGGYVSTFLTFNIFTNYTGEIVSGRVLKSDGTPLQGATITVKQGSTTKKTVTTNAKGIWAATGLSSSTTFTVIPSYPGYEFSSRSATTGKSNVEGHWIALSGSADTYCSCGNVWGVDFVGVNTGTTALTGTVKTSDGNPLVGCTVQFGSYSATVDQSGTYFMEVPKNTAGTLKLPDGSVDGCSPASYTLSSSDMVGGTTLTKNFTVTYSLARAVDQPTWTFGNSSSYPWTVVFDKKRTTASAKSAKMDSSTSLTEESRLTTTVIGPGVISFWVLPQFKRGMHFYYDGGTVYTIGADTGVKETYTEGSSAWVPGAWTFCQYAIPAGSHTLYWDVGCSGSNGNKCENIGWLDEIVWTPDSAGARIAVDSATGDTWSTATIHGTIWALNGASSGTVKVEYSKNSNFSNSTTVEMGTVNGTGDWQGQLAGLELHTTYYARLILTAGGSTVTSDGSVTFTTQDGTPPVIESVTLANKSIDYISVNVAIGDIGGGSTGVSILVQAIAPGGAVAASANGTSAGVFTLSGLSRKTVYAIRVTATASTGKQAVFDSLSIETMDGPEFQLGAPVAEVALDGKSVKLQVPVQALNVTGALYLFLNNEEKTHWDCTPASAGVYSNVLSVARGSTNVFSFVGIGQLAGEWITNTVSGTFIATTYTGWFDVQFADTGYVRGATWAADSVDRSEGSWTTADPTYTELSAGDAPVVTFDEEHDEEIVYTPHTPSEVNADATITGTIEARTGSKSEFDPNAIGVVKFVEGEGEYILPSVYVGGAWHTFGTGGFSEGEMVDYRLDFLYGGASAKLKVTVGPYVSDWYEFAQSPRQIAAVGFGGGAVGDFKGWYWSLLGEGAPIELPKPLFSEGSVAVGSRTIDSQTYTTYSVTVSNPRRGFYYTVFTAERLTDKFKAVRAIQGPQSGSPSVLFETDAATLPLTIDIDPEQPSAFVKIVGSDHPFTLGDEL